MYSHPITRKIVIINSIMKETVFKYGLTKFEHEVAHYHGQNGNLGKKNMNICVKVRCYKV